MGDWSEMSHAPSRPDHHCGRSAADAASSSLYRGIFPFDANVLTLDRGGGDSRAAD
jgi:hypothetical protein